MSQDRKESQSEQWEGKVKGADFNLGNWRKPIQKNTLVVLPNIVQTNPLLHHGNMQIFLIFSIICSYNLGLSPNKIHEIYLWC